MKCKTMRTLKALLRELPPGSIRGDRNTKNYTAVPHVMPFDEFSRIWNGWNCCGEKDIGAVGEGFGLQYSSVAHIPFIDQLPSAWNAGRRDVNRSSFIMWDKSGEDTLFYLWRDGLPRPPLTTRHSNTLTSAFTHRSSSAS